MRERPRPEATNSLSVPDDPIKEILPRAPHISSGAPQPKSTKSASLLISSSELDKLTPQCLWEIGWPVCLEQNTSRRLTGVF